MNRLTKKANHVSPQMHNAVTDHIQGDHNVTKRLFSNYNFMIAKRLLADLPIVPTNERAYELTQQIQMGLFDDISSVEEAEQNWDAWLTRTIEYLKSIGIFIGNGDYEGTSYFKQ
jgi:hypothetical protein